MKKMVLLATVVGVVALIMAAAPAMATENGHNGAFNNGGVIIQNGNVGFNTGFNTGLGFNGCCNTGFDGCFNFGCNNNVFFTPVVGFNTCDWWVTGGCNTWNTWGWNNGCCGHNDWDDHWRWNHDRDDNWRWKHDKDDWR
jgi:hypothetical protein